MNIIYKIRQLKKIRNDRLLSLYTSLFGIFVCILCLAGTTWAWFNAYQNIGIDSIKAADKFLDSLSIQKVEVVFGEPSEDGEVESWYEKSTVSLKDRQYGKTFYAVENVLYKVNTVIGGSAEYGFLTIETPDGIFYTTNENCNFSLILSQSGSVNISVSWGEETGYAKKFSSGQTLGYGELPVIETEVISGGTSEKTDTSGSQNEIAQEQNPNTESNDIQQDEASENTEKSTDTSQGSIESVELTSANVEE